MWNIAYDGGTGLGAVTLGVLVTAAGYSRSFGVTAVGIAAVGLVLVVAALLAPPRRMRERGPYAAPTHTTQEGGGREQI